ncbi:integrase, catalytic region, zinc finger, CCHC-type containing protein [Tanacetum coccineum]
MSQRTLFIPPIPSYCFHLFKSYPPDYSKENLLATFAPQRNLTPEQIFWSIDNNDRKKAETSVPKPLSALTVYPPNTPVKLVPRVLPTKSQVKINLYVLTQLFTEFDKTCKKRITPTGVTEGERGFEQTKRCYLTEVIPFFKTLKEHFAGVQTALFKEVKVMEEIFDQMNDEVDQNTVDKQCAEIERKNLLIANENLIANCLSNQLLYDVEKSRCLDLETEMSKVQNEIKHVSKLEREYLNLQLKYQHLQESFDNNKSQTSQDVPEFNSFFKINNLENQIQEKDNVIRDLKVLVSNVNDRSCEPYNANDVTGLLEQNERLRAEIEKVKQHYKEMFESIKITRTSNNEQTSSLLTQIEDLKAQFEGNLKVATRSSVKTKVLTPGMYAIDVKPIPHPLKNNRSAHLNYINHLKESVEIVMEIVEEARRAVSEEEDWGRVLLRQISEVTEWLSQCEAYIAEINVLGPRLFAVEPLGIGFDRASFILSVRFLVTVSISSRVVLSLTPPLNQRRTPLPSQATLSCLQQTLNELERTVSEEEVWGRVLLHRISEVTERLSQCEAYIAKIKDLAVDMTLSALLGDNIYNFGELLVHPTIKSLKICLYHGYTTCLRHSTQEICLTPPLNQRRTPLPSQATLPCLQLIKLGASGGDYMEMAAHTRVTIAGPNGVVRSKFTFGKLYEKIGFNKEVISKGRFSEVNASHSCEVKVEDAQRAIFDIAKVPEFHAILLEFSFSEGRGQPVIGARVYLCKWQTLICYQLNTLYSGCPQEMLQASGVVLELLTGSHAVDKEKVGGRRMPRGGNRSRDRGRRDNREFLHENRTKALDNNYQNGVFKYVRGGGPRTCRPVTKNNVEAPANNRRLEDGQVQFYHKVYACLVTAGGLCVVLQCFQNLCLVHREFLSAQPTLVENENKILEKCHILCLMDIIYSRPSQDRTISLSLIAKRTKLSVKDAGYLLLKSLYVRLVPPLPLESSFFKFDSKKGCASLIKVPLVRHRTNSFYVLLTMTGCIQLLDLIDHHSDFGAVHINYGYGLLETSNGQIGCKGLLQRNTTRIALSLLKLQEAFYRALSTENVDLTKE